MATPAQTLQDPFAQTPTTLHWFLSLPSTLPVPILTGPAHVFKEVAGEEAVGAGVAPHGQPHVSTYLQAS